MTWSLFPLVWVSLCVILALGLWRAEWKWSRPACRFGPTSARISCFYQARGEDSLGLLGFSGVWVSLRALCRTEPMISSDLCLFYRIIFRFRAHLVIPQTAALCSLITLWLQAAVSLCESTSWRPNCYGGLNLSNTCCIYQNIGCSPSGKSQIYPSWLCQHSWREQYSISSPQTWKWTLKRCSFNILRVINSILI